VGGPNGIPASFNALKKEPANHALHRRLAMRNSCDQKNNIGKKPIKA
jgi:hypothetical protein